MFKLYTALLKGHPRLVQAISAVYSPRFGRSIDPMNEVLPSPGAIGSLYYATQGLINPGDEVLSSIRLLILIELY